MSVDELTPAPVQIIVGQGPYIVPHPYGGADELEAIVVAGTVRTSLSVTQFSMVPSSSEVSGSLYLESAVALEWAGQKLAILRKTRNEQGYSGENAREVGLRRQLDRMVQGAQDNQLLIGGALRMPPDLGPVRPMTEAPDQRAGRVILWSDDGTTPQSGPTAGDIASAQGHAASAAASASAAALYAPVYFDDLQALRADTTVFAPGTILTTRKDRISYEVVPAGAGDQHDQTQAVGVYEAGPFSNLARFQAAVARGVTYASGATETAAGTQYVKDGGDSIPGLPGWSQASVYDRLEVVESYAGIHAALASPVLIAFGASADMILDFEKGLYARGGVTVGLGDVSTFSRGAAAQYLDAAGKLQTAAEGVLRYDWSKGRRGVLIEGASTNLCTINNASPADTTGLTLSGDAAATLTRITDATALAAAGLDPIVTHAFRLDNSAGVDRAFVAVSGPVVDLTPHTASCYVRGGSGSIGLDMSGRTPFDFTGAYTRVSATMTPDSTARKFSIVANAGEALIFCLPQLEDLPFASSPILTAGATAMRPADVLVLTKEVHVSGMAVLEFFRPETAAPTGGVAGLFCVDVTAAAAGFTLGMSPTGYLILQIDDGVNSGFYNGIDLVDGLNRVAVAWDLNTGECAVAVNGGNWESYPPVAGWVPVVPDRYQVGTQSNVGGLPRESDCVIKNISIYPEEAFTP
ncbi:MAG: phage head spike fiber domain-containing protein [Salipiger marinus]|uniref:phage head spike fiber domain-containing protein n=1 Tax=Salipiger marinus TaxID=555512 RepID=UPI004058AB10